MRRNTQLRLIADTPSASINIKLTDTSGNPSESYHWPQMAAVRREWRHEFWCPHLNGFEPTLAEIIDNEKWVRRELYP